MGIFEIRAKTAAETLSLAVFNISVDLVVLLVHFCGLLNHAQINIL
jgi:hypothetical protein